ncbi:MAG: T9SS type A sorting domain-containing protein [Bacteroidales bacterium]|nr:T9SS type A sorting domain-containing protein [Bacteroidales bacterium]
MKHIFIFILIINTSFLFSQNKNEKATITWTGNTDTYWDKTTNWSTNTLPLSTDNVIIPTTPTGGNFPLRTGVAEAVCNNLTIEAGAELTIRTTDGGMHIYGNLLIETPNNAGSAGSLIEYDNLRVDGTVTYKRYYNVNGKWQYICSPLNNSTGDLFTRNTQSGNFNPNFLRYNESYNCNPDPGGTYPEWSSTDLVYAWENHHNGESGAAENLAIGIGYATYNEGDITVEFSGNTHSVINNEDINIPVTLNVNDGNSGYYDGWNLVGNPYTSAINWDRGSAASKGDIQNTAYFWDSDTENYKYINGRDETGNHNEVSYVVNGAVNDKYIPAGQGFFVKATADGNYTLSRSARGHYINDLWKNKNSEKNKKTNISNEKPIQFIKLRIEDAAYSDETVIKFKEDATYGFDDDYDAYKLASSNENIPLIYSGSDDGNTIMSINSLPFPENDIYQIPLSLKTKEAKQYTIKLKESEYSDLDIFLKDNYENTLTDLKKQDQYSFYYEGGQDNNRFAIYYNAKSTDIDQDFTNDILIYPNPSKGIFFIETPEQANSIIAKDITGKEIYILKTSVRKIKLDLSEYAKGIYFITINYKSKLVTKKIIIQ